MNDKIKNEKNLPIYEIIIDDSNEIGISFISLVGQDNLENEPFIIQQEKVSEIDLKRTCQYRNCGCDISGKRPNAKYCSKQCKSNEKKYIKREDKRILDERNRISDMLAQIKSSDENIIDLYKNIYK